MCKCSICGADLKKGHSICLGCTKTIECQRKKDQAPEHAKRAAQKHLKRNPGLVIIPFGAFKRK
jgi:hypothetical protein